MATFSHTSSIIPVEVKEPVFDFVSSGLHQIERVLKGPRARQEVGRKPVTGSLDVKCNSNKLQI